MRSITIEMPYIGAVLSVNHYLGRTRYGTIYVKRDVKKWKESLGWLLKTSHIEDWKLPLQILVGGVFRDKRSCPDLHNCLKVICDAIEELTGINDRYFRTETGQPTIDKTKTPSLFITVKEIS